MPITSIPGGGGGGGSVTSVGLDDNTGLFDVTGSPVTTAGDITLDLANQDNKKVFIAPIQGDPAGPPSFRVLEAEDLAAAPSGTTFLRGDMTWATPAGTGSNVSYGTFAALPATCALGDIYYVSDKRWMYVATATNTWEARLNGVPIVPPLAANFTYTINTSSTSTVTDTYAGMKVTKGNQNGAAVLRSNTAAPSTFTFEIGFDDLQKPGASFSTFGLSLQTNSSSTTPLEVAGSVFDTSSTAAGFMGVSYFSPPASFQSNLSPIVGYAVSSGQVWIRVVKDVTNLTYYASRNGIDWAQYQQHAVAANLASVGFLGFAMYNENGPSSPTVNNDTYSVFHFKVV